ncbi:MAG: phytanoyl-CoA dioxygenase family protein [Gammaproteobacteria bacterium]|nr:phytanoyl-CoA dioxygenase family protein [Gammaproteobacteria bacterium]
MAEFASRGFVKLEGVVPPSLNESFLAELERTFASDQTNKGSTMPAVPAGTTIDEALPNETILGQILRLPPIRGAIESLVGTGSLLDHHFVHVLPPKNVLESMGRQANAQHLHQDSTIDVREAFDIQLFYFPQQIDPEMGGTRYLPGSHLRIVNEGAIARYQNVVGQQHVVCEAGTIFFMHHGIWHGGSINVSERTRYLYKLRLNPTVPQVRLWDTSDLTTVESEPKPIFFVRQPSDPNSIQNILTRSEPWFEGDTGRIEFINRVRFWRRLLGDPSFDAHYWVTRLEQNPTARDEINTTLTSI